MLLFNECNSVKTYWDKDPQTGLNIIKYSQDVQPIVDDNIAFQNSGCDGWNRARDMVHAATIPHVVLIEWAKKYGKSVREFYQNTKLRQDIMRRELNDSDNQFLRRWKGHL